MNCDTGAICPHNPQCDHICQAIETRKVKPYPIVPADIEPVPQAWQIVGSVVVGFVFVALVVIAALFFFTGFYIWTLLI